MSHLTFAVRQLLSQARTNLAAGSRDLGITQLSLALRELDNIPDPIDFLALTIEAESMVQTWCLPNPEDLCEAKTETPSTLN